MVIRATCPIRRFDIGQWTDCWFAGTGQTFNFAGWPGVHVTVFRKPVRRTKANHFGYPVTMEIPDKTITIHAKDLDATVHLEDCRMIEYDGHLDLLKAAVKRTNLEGITAVIRSDMPPACGVGTSAAVSVALVGALSQLKGDKMSNRQIAALAQKLEIEELKIQCGIQDQYGCALGGAWGAGIFVMHEYPDNIEIVPLPLHLIPESTFLELNERLLLVYVGSRSSSAFHEKVIKNITAGDTKSLAALETLRNQPERMVEALVKADFHLVADVMMTNWQAQQDLHPDVGSPILKAVEKVVLKHGAMAVKANGAGGGGSMEILISPGHEADVRKAILGIEGAQVLESGLTRWGLRTWTTCS